MTEAFFLPLPKIKSIKNETDNEKYENEQNVCDAYNVLLSNAMVLPRPKLIKKNYSFFKVPLVIPQKSKGLFLSK